MLRVRCPSCQVYCDFPDELAGQKVACACGQKLQLTPPASQNKTVLVPFNTVQPQIPYATVAPQQEHRPVWVKPIKERRADVAGIVSISIGVFALSLAVIGQRYLLFGMLTSFILLPISIVAFTLTFFAKKHQGPALLISTVALLLALSLVPEIRFELVRIFGK